LSQLDQVEIPIKSNSFFLFWACKVRVSRFCKKH